MMKFYRDAYSEELERIVKDGVEYDADEDSSISTSEKTPLHFGRQVR